MITFTDPRRFGFMDLLTPRQLAVHPALSALGAEPLSEAFTAASLAAAFAGKKTSLKAALLDQRVVAGLGNIYAVEALHRAGLSPLRRASTIATPAGRPRPPRDGNRERVLMIRTAGLDALVAQHTFAVVADVEVVIDRDRLRDRGRHRPRRSPAHSLEGSSPRTQRTAERLSAAIKEVLREAVARKNERGSRGQRFRVYDREEERCLTRGCGGAVERRPQTGRSTFYCPACQR